MKILGISFGTKNGNNDTMCKVALKGAKEAGAEVEFIQMSSINIKHCTGCCACVKTLLSGKGSMCVLKDDFEWLLDKMKDADGIVVSDPIFEEGASGLFHTIMDRFGPRADRGNNIIGTKVAEAIGGKIPDLRMLNDKVISFMGIGGSDWGTRVQCEHAMLALIPMWKVIDNAWFPWAKELVMDDTRLVQVHQIGLNIVKAAKDFEKASYQGEEGVCPHCHNRLFYLEPGTKKAICALCGIVGELDTISGKTIFSFPEEQLGHAHDTLPGKFIHGDDIKKMEGHYAEVRKTQEFKERKTSYNFIEPLTKEKQAGVSLG
ncbi:flavodoxin family protein [Clostridioides difficile]|uniref:flavodoxin family protein n=1 Tax=Clostridioides difficile TaxID=1496 RepID=UPI0018FE22D1|nr:NAD(P)H-dependent oxidoreductase [Clostridioides difficile]MDL5067394.1 NAD(P)H-dependent oxidoreductase [Clostridioides difficile]MDN9453688.1 flavodoxin family protein [Clostridioides difficile]HBF7898681.1 NAD(P)H-dependent oxidoreductase [Clostridioides difficile]